MFSAGQKVKNPRSGKVFEILKYQDNFYYMRDKFKRKYKLSRSYVEACGFKEVLDE